MADIFRRVEKKYIITARQYEMLKEVLKNYMVEDEHGKSTIRNIYYDSKCYDLISHSITKPYIKEKVRVRSYNTPNKESTVFLEIKRKCEGVVGKRRISMKYSELGNYQKDKTLTKCDNNQIKSELDYYFEKYDLEPKMYVSYSREAFYKKDDRDFRITFDSNILARQYDLRLDATNIGTNILERNKYVMEIKTLGTIPLWLVRLLDEFQISPCGFSKYGEAYTQLVLKANTCEKLVV